MKENDFATGEQRQLLHVRDNGPIGRGTFQGDQNGFIHIALKPGCRYYRIYRPTMTCQADLSESGSPLTSMAVITRALPQPANKRTQPFFHLPIRLRDEVKWSSGNM